jgi:hypothetical protein
MRSLLLFSQAWRKGIAKDKFMRRIDSILIILVQLILLYVQLNAILDCAEDTIVVVAL